MNLTETLFEPVSRQVLENLATTASGPAGSLPLTPEMLLGAPSGDLFGLSQNAGMGWDPSQLGGGQFLILSTQGGLPDADGRPIALGYHTGHWEIHRLVKAAAEELRRLGCIPFAGFVSDPCDGRTQGTTGMFDSLPYRNEAAIVFRRLARSLPTRAGILGIATCDKGLPAMLMAVAGLGDLPAVVVPGGVTLPPRHGEDAGKIQTIGARYALGLLSLQEAADLGCRACATPGGGCQFLGTAATAQVVAEALGLALPHSALAPSGQPVWTDVAVRSARTLVQLSGEGIATRHWFGPEHIKNAMAVHAAFGGSTNLVLHLPAIAHAAGLPRPTVKDWQDINRKVPRLVDVLPNGPRQHPTIRVFLAGGVPEVMLHLRDLGLLELSARTVAGASVEEVLAAWERSERRRVFRDALRRHDQVEPDEVILPPALARERGLRSTVTFLGGNLAPAGALIKSTAIDPARLDAAGVFLHEAAAKVFTCESKAMAALKEGRIRGGDIVVLAGIGPMGTGMEETAQLTIALKHLPFGNQVTLITDGRFSGVSTGACIGHVGPEALAGGPIGKLQDGDVIRVRIDCAHLEGSIDFLGRPRHPVTAEEGQLELAARCRHPEIAPHPQLPQDTRLWAALQQASGGTWGGCVYDAEEVERRLGFGREAH